MGDMNVNYLVENDHEVIKDIFTGNGFKQILNTPKHVTDQNSSLIDLIFVNMNQNISYKTGLSDHDLIVCVRKVYNVKYELETIRYRNYKNYDVSVINKELLNINWDGVYKSNSRNQSLNVMKSILKDIIDKHGPFITKRVKRKKSPWMSKEIKLHMNIPDQLYRKARKSKKQLDWISYKCKRNFAKTKSKEPKKTLSTKN